MGDLIQAGAPVPARAHPIRGAVCLLAVVLVRGRVLPMTRTKRDPLVRFYEMTERQGECLVWTRARTEKGYGKFYADGVMHRAHRWIYQRLVGPISDDVLVRHSCDNPPCVEIAHLIEGTNADNSADMTSRRRSAGQKKTHCPRNHEYTEDNIYWHKGWRYCKTCTKARSRAQVERERNARQRDSSQPSLPQGADSN